MTAKYALIFRKKNKYYNYIHQLCMWRNNLIAFEEDKIGAVPRILWNLELIIATLLGLAIKLVLSAFILGINFEIPMLPLSAF